MAYPKIATIKRQGPRNGNRLFGTSGIRGVVGQDLSVGLCLEAAQAIGTTLAPHSRVGIATDTRVSRELIKRAVISGLRFSGIDVTDLGVLPTPALAFLTRDMGFDTGVMITASHNPPQFNGIKLFNGNCVGYSQEQEAEIEKIYDEKEFRIGDLGSLEQSQEGKERYFRFMQQRFPPESLNRNIKMVVDPGNGAASRFASELFSRLGLHVTPLNDEPDGCFPGRNPEPREDTLEGTIKFTMEQNADIAVCFDGDADRVVFCDGEGFLGFNEAITFIARLAVEESKKRKVVTTVETGRFLDLALKDLGVKVIRGRVGDVNVAHLAQELDAAIGVEPVGVYIMPPVGYYPDSILATLTLLSQIRQAGEIREFFKGMPQLFSGQRKLSCPDSLKAAVMAKIEENANFSNTSRLNTLDGLRFEFDDSWILIRASGTEPAIRLIAESTSMAETEALLNTGAQTVEQIWED
jgi:phosphoglucosamine mutase